MNEFPSPCRQLIMQKEPYKRESQKGIPFSQLNNFCSCLSVSEATADREKVAHLAGSFDRHDSDENSFPLNARAQRGITVVGSCCHKILTAFLALIYEVPRNCKHPYIYCCQRYYQLYIIEEAYSKSLFCSLLFLVLECIHFPLEARKEISYALKSNKLLTDFTVHSKNH